MIGPAEEAGDLHGGYRRAGDDAHVAHRAAADPALARDRSAPPLIDRFERHGVCLWFSLAAAVWGAAVPTPCGAATAIHLSDLPEG